MEPTILTTLAALVSWLAVAWPSAAASEQVRITCIASDQRSLSIRADIPSPGLLSVEAASLTGAAGAYVELDIPGLASTGPIGQPKVPVAAAVIDAPLGAEFELAVTGGSYREFSVDRPVLPSLTPVPKVPGAKQRFVIDGSTYTTDAFFPGRLAELVDASKEAGLARGHRLVSVRLFPVQYNPVTGIVRHYSRLEVSVTFRGADWSRTASSIKHDFSPAWEEFVQRLVVNPGQADSKAPLALPIYYDIFYGQSFAAAAKRLADWKSQLGYKVRLADASGWTSQMIDDTIRLRSPLASYVLLISDPNAGGPDSLPTFGNGPASASPTDLYYAEAGQSGYYPDLFLGRLTVKTAAEADVAVDKIIRYQQADFGSAGTAWLSKALFIAGFDYGWQGFAAATHEYCRSMLVANGYQVDTLIMANGEQQGRITARIDQGRAWTVYSAHGNPLAWLVGYSGDFNATEVGTDLHNLDRYTMAMGHCCLSGYFSYSQNCFGEVWLRSTGKAGIGFFGSVPLTYWYEDDWLQRRYFDAIYDSAPGLPGPRLTEAGRFTQYGLYWIDLHTSTDLKQYYFEAYHVLGDPSLDFWTGQPGSLSVAHPANIPPQGGGLAVGVKISGGSPVPGAMVCAWSRSDPSLQVAGYTDSSGIASLSLPPGTIGDTLWLIASKHDFRPNRGWVLVRSSLKVTLSTELVTVSKPTPVWLTVTDPDSGGAPVRSLEIYLSQNASLPWLAASTDSTGTAQFTLDASQGGYCEISGRRAGQSAALFTDTIWVVAPLQCRIARSYPNPSAGRFQIDFELSRGADVRVAVYNILGQRVRTLWDGARTIGYHSLSWDGADDKGRRVSSGVYFCCLSGVGLGRPQARRLVLVH